MYRSANPKTPKPQNPKTPRYTNKNNLMSLIEIC